MKKKNKIVKIVAILVLIIFVIGTGLYIKRRNNYIYITQFSPTTSRQMMGYAIKTLNGKIVVIDGGLQEDAQQLEKYITDNGGEVDTWFITHPHIDHAGAFEIISQNTSIKIDKIYMSIEDKDWYLTNEPSRTIDIEEFFKVINQEKIAEKIIEPQVNDIIKIDNITAKILGTKNPEITTNAINNSSMVIQIQVNQKKILFLGDTGTESSEKLIKNQGKNLKSDIVQVAHHGQAGATEELYKIVNPKILKEKGKQKVEEGCLSFPNQFAKMIRPKEVTVEALNENGEQIRIEAVDLLAQALVHEIEHLDGILFVDNMIPGTLQYVDPEEK